MRCFKHPFFRPEGGTFVGRKCLYVFTSCSVVIVIYVIKGSYFIRLQLFIIMGHSRSHFTFTIRFVLIIFRILTLYNTSKYDRYFQQGW